MRGILQLVLEYLAKWAIRKHNMELIVVSGKAGIDLVREGIYVVLSEKYQVRRNVKPVWWDLSIPLNILGYVDKKRSIAAWLNVIFKSWFVLVFGPKNPSILVLSAESGRKETAKYWYRILKPDYLVIANYIDKSPVVEFLLNSTKDYGRVIYNPDEITLKQRRTFMYGKDKSAKLIFKENKDAITYVYKDYKLKVEKYFLPPYTKNIVGSILSLAIYKGMKFEDAVNGLLKFDLRNKILTQISENIGQ